MGKTYKDQANYNRFKRHKTELELPEPTELETVMWLHGAGYRYGNQRHDIANAKVKQRRAERAAAKQSLRKTVYKRGD